MRRSSAPSRRGRDAARAAAAIAAGVALAVAGCKPQPPVPAVPASFWPCPPGQHFTEHYQEWGCWPS